jgi:UDP-galactopyranose mutase
LKTDILIAGAGLSGLVIAERLSAAGARCLLVEKRGEIGGNCLDGYDEHGVLIHRYGPHYFRTNSSRVVRYLSRFTEWKRQDFKILSHTEGRYWSFPVNLMTFEQMIGRESSTAEFESYLAGQRIPFEHPSNSEQVILSRLGRDFYERFFLNYTRKQWGREPSELDVSVCRRIPLRMGRAEHCFSERFQGIPSEGYHALFRRMSEASHGAELVLGTDYRELLGKVAYRHLIVTGPIDEFFDYRHGRLPYRTIRFEREHIAGDSLKARRPESGQEGFWQPAVQVNNPGQEPFTRCVEIKHVTGQRCEGTTLVREYPDEHGPDTDPYYPVPSRESAVLHRRYVETAAQHTDMTFLGRLGTYRYLNMDQTVAFALQTADVLARCLGFSPAPCP